MYAEGYSCCILSYHSIFTSNNLLLNRKEGESLVSNLSRRQFLKTACVSAIAVTLSGGCAKSLENVSQKRPNILFALADDWGWPHAGAYGDKVVKTPTFDRLAREGVLFEHAYVSSPSCAPCRSSIVTGQQFYRLGEGANINGTLDINEPNFMYMLRGSGYDIGHWKKAWGPGDAAVGGYTESPCGPQIKLSKLLAKRDKNTPFCFWLGTSDPHRPYEKDSGRNSGMDLSKVHVPKSLPDNEIIRADIADYYFEVQEWDADVTNAIKQLEKAGELENTIVVMTGDHNMPFPRGKCNLYDWGSRVPLAIRWGKNIKGGRKVSDFTSLTDLAPTFLQAAGMKIPEQMTGKSLMGILTSKKEGRVDKKRDFMVYGKERHMPAQKAPSLDGYPMRALRTDKWLLILNLAPDRWPAGVEFGSKGPMEFFNDCDNSPSKTFIIENRNDPKVAKYFEMCFAKRPAVELYDCDVDPYQVNNLAGNPKYAKITKKMRKQLTDYLVETEDPRFTDEPVMFDKYPFRPKGLR